MCILLYFYFQTKMEKSTSLDEKHIFFCETFFVRLDSFLRHSFSQQKISKYFSCEFGGSIPSVRTFFFMKCVWCVLYSQPKTKSLGFLFVPLYLPWIGLKNWGCTFPTLRFILQEKRELWKIDDFEFLGIFDVDLKTQIQFV